MKWTSTNPWNTVVTASGLNSSVTTSTTAHDTIYYTTGTFTDANAEIASQFALAEITKIENDEQLIEAVKLEKRLRELINAQQYNFGINPLIHRYRSDIADGLTQRIDEYCARTTQGSSAPDPGRDHPSV